MPERVLEGKNYVVTGANSGIGYVAAERFAALGANVALVCRSEGRGAAAARSIMAATGNENVQLYLADFSSLASVSQMADSLLAELPRIDVLCNNAGAANANRVVTEEGFELTFVSNHLSPFLLTQKLLPSILAASQEGLARVVFSSSYGHFNSALDFGDLGLSKDYGALRAYGRSKLMNLLTAREMQRRMMGESVAVSAFHPGTVRTPIWSKSGFLARVLGIVAYPFMISAEKGADTLIWLASSEDAASKEAGGEYFFRRARSKTAEFATDEAARKLWQISEELVQDYL